MKVLSFFLLVTLTGSLAFAQSKEEAAIKQVIEAETKAVWARDWDKWLTCFAQTDDLIFGYSTGLPTYMLRGYKELAKWVEETKAKNMKPHESTYQMRDYRFRIRDNNAFVSSIQVTTEKDGSTRRSHKVDYLEKINGEWKIVGHLFGNEPTTPSQTATK